MKKIITKIREALQVVLLAPIKLPGKALNILKYAAVGIGILEKVLEAPEHAKGLPDKLPDAGEREINEERGGLNEDK